MATSAASESTDVLLETSTEGPQVINNGLLLKVKGQEHPFAQFSYALGPKLETPSPVDWKILITEDVQSQNIRCHMLEEGDSLASLASLYKQTYTVALVIVNNTDSYTLDDVFLEEEMDHDAIPVLVLPRNDGMRLIRALDRQEAVFAHINVESAVDIPVQSPPTSTSCDGHQDLTKKEPGTGMGERIIQFFRRNEPEKQPLMDLKSEMNKVIFSTQSGEPVIVCEDEGRFRIVMGLLHQYEKQARAKPNHSDIGLKKLQRHFNHTFHRDFPFYLLLAYRIREMREVMSFYKSDDLNDYIKDCITRIEMLMPHTVASTLTAFVQSNNFIVQLEDRSYNIFFLLKHTCEEMLEISLRYKMFERDRKWKIVYPIMLWVIMSLKFHSERDFDKGNSSCWWKKYLLKSHNEITFDIETVSDLKRGLEFGLLVHLAPNLSPIVSNDLILPLLVSQNHVRPFEQVKYFLQVVESYILPESELYSFVTRIRAHYHSWLKGGNDTVELLKATSEAGTLAGTLDEGLIFLDVLFEVLSHRHTNEKLRDAEVLKWLHLILGLVDVTHDNAKAHLSKFLMRRTVVTKKFRADIIRWAIQITEEKFAVLTIHQFSSLYQAFRIWPKTVLEKYLGQYQVQRGVKICDPVWHKFFSEIVSRFDSAQHHQFLINFLHSVSQCYLADNQGKEFILDLLQLRVKLFHVEEGMEEEVDTVVQQEFITFLSCYISRNTIKEATLKQMPQILEVVISSESDEFQQQILTVLQKEVIPEFKALQGSESVSSSPFCSALHMTVNFLSKDLSWLTSVTMKQRFCWKIVATVCTKIPVSNENLEWINAYTYLISQLGTVFQAYCHAKKMTGSQLLLTFSLPADVTHSSEKDVLNYFDWVRRMQEILSHWQYQFNQLLVNYDDVLNYASHQHVLRKLSESVNAQQCVISSETLLTTKVTLLEVFEQLNLQLIRYIPGEPEARWCTLPAVLVDYGISLPQPCDELISKHVLFPGEEKALDCSLLENSFCSNTSGQFKLPQNISLRLTKAVALKNLKELVESLMEFLNPLAKNLNMLVFFKLHNSEFFNKFMRLHLHKEQDLREKESLVSSLPSLFPPYEPEPENLQAVISALSKTRCSLLKLIEGTATYQEMTIEGELDLEKLDIMMEFESLTIFSTSFLPPLTTYKGLSGVQSMLELFKYSRHIETIHQICEQYKLSDCLRDPTLQELLQLVEPLKSEDIRAKMNPIEAAEQLKAIKDALCLSDNSQCRSLDTFAAIATSASFSKFVHDQKFVGEEGLVHFQQQYKLISAQLHNEEMVLSHLYAAYQFIQPVMNTKQDFSGLMKSVTSLNATNGLKWLDTVDANMKLIRLWFSHSQSPIEQIERALAVQLQQSQQTQQDLKQHLAKLQQTEQNLRSQLVTSKAQLAQTHHMEQELKKQLQQREQDIKSQLAKSQQVEQDLRLQLAQSDQSEQHLRLQLVQSEQSEQDLRLQLAQSEQDLSLQLANATKSMQDLQMQSTHNEQTLRTQVVQLEEDKLHLQQQLQLQSHSHASSIELEFWNVPRSDIHIVSEIDRGGWGAVLKGTFQGRAVAVKQLHCSILSNDNVRRLRREVHMMAQVRHPNLLLFIAAVFDNEVEMLKSPPLIVMELLDTDLRKAYTTNLIRSQDRVPIFRDIAYALNYLHNCREPIIHRDLSAPNVLLEALANDHWKAKVSDFGSANLVKFARTAAEGAIIYSAPETLPDELRGPNAPIIPQTPKVDVYSYGVLLCEVILCKQPDQFKQMKAEIEQSWPFMHSLISSCTNYYPDNRPTIDQVLKELQKIP